LSWPNTRLVARDAVETVREMKDQGSTSMRTMGSLTLCRSLLTAGLVDRFRVVVFPVITGSRGQERSYDGRTRLLEYAPTVLTRPPGTDNASSERRTR
jgi:dihydrofolate reductase